MILILAKNLSKQDRPLSDLRSFVRVFLMVIIPGMVTDLGGFAVFALSILVQKRRQKNQ